MKKFLILFSISFYLALHFISHSMLGRVLYLMMHTGTYRNQVISVGVMIGIVTTLALFFMIFVSLFFRVLMRMFRDDTPASQTTPS